MTTSDLDGDLIRSLTLFKDVSEHHLATLVAAASLRQVRARAVLFAEGDRVDNLYTLVRGSAELFSEHDDRRFTIGVVGAARSLAVSSVLAQRHPLSARAIEPSELIAVPAKLVVELISRDPGLANAVVRELANDSVQIIEDFKSHRLLTTTERIAHWMLHCDKKTGGSGQIVIPFDKRILASYLGMAPEQLSRSFSALASAGVVVKGRSITLTDRIALAEVAGGWSRLNGHSHGAA